MITLTIYSSAQIKFWLNYGVTNLWITPEPVRASQSHPKSPRAGKSHPRITQSQLEPTRARPEPGQSQLKFNIKEVLREKLNSYSFSLTQIINFFSTSCFSDIKQWLHQGLRNYRCPGNFLTEIRGEIASLEIKFFCIWTDFFPFFLNRECVFLCQWNREQV